MTRKRIPIISCKIPLGTPETSKTERVFSPIQSFSSEWISFVIFPSELGIKPSGFKTKSKRGSAIFAHLKQAFPQAGILIVGVGDREYKTEEGSLRTMPGIKNLIRYQQNLAADSGVAFWNMFEAMGGEGSMADMVHAKPSLANYDYTHINFRGGKHLAELLYEALVYGKEQYDRRRAYEAEP